MVRCNWRVYCLQKKPLISESGFSTLTCHMRCFVIGSLPAFSVISWLFLGPPTPHTHMHVHCQTHPTASKLSFPDQYLEWVNILLLPFLLHLPICWLPTHPSCVSQISSLGGFLSPIISRLLSPSLAVPLLEDDFFFFFFIFTPLAMPPCSCASRSPKQLILSNGQVEAETQFALHSPDPSWCTSSPLEGDTFCNSPKGTVWARGDPVLASSHYCIQHPSQRPMEKILIKFPWTSEKRGPFLQNSRKKQVFGGRVLI